MAYNLCTALSLCHQCRTCSFVCTCHAQSFASGQKPYYVTTSIISCDDSQDAISTTAAPNEESVRGVTSSDVMMKDNPAYQPMLAVEVMSATMTLQQMQLCPCSVGEH